MTRFDTFDDTAARAIASLPAGATFTAFYVFGGSTAYRVTTRSGKKRIEAGSRHRTITGAASVKNFLGRPYRIEIS